MKFAVIAMMVCLFVGCSAAPPVPVDEGTYTVLSTALYQAESVALGQGCKDANIPAAYLAPCPAAPDGASDLVLGTMLKKCAQQKLAAIATARIVGMICAGGGLIVAEPPK